MMNKNKVTNDFSLDFWEKTFGKLKKKDIELIIPGAYTILQKEIKFIKQIGQNFCLVELSTLTYFLIMYSLKIINFRES